LSDLAAAARAAATHCEARKTAYRQTKEGVVVSFVIHPNDVPDSVALAQLGTRYLLALVEIGDDEQPITHSPATAESSRESAAVLPENGGNQPINAREKSDAARERGKAAFAALPDMKKDVVKAAMMVRSDATFQGWLLDDDFNPEWPTDNWKKSAAELNDRLRIKSKAEIGESREVNERWQKLLTTYQRDTNQLAEIRG
jgi:hypothetical protein